MRNSEPAILGRCRRHIRAGRASEALRLVEPLVEERPDDPDGWAVLGAALFELEDYEGSARAARRVVELRPESARHWSNLGTVLRKTGDLEEAERAQHRALSLNPEYDRALVELDKIQDAATKPSAPEMRFSEPPTPSPATKKPTETHERSAEPSAEDTEDRAGNPLLVAAIVLAGILIVAFGLVVTGRLHLFGDAETQPPPQAAQARAQTEQEEPSAEEVRAAVLRDPQLRYEMDQEMLTNTPEYVQRFHTVEAANRTDAQTKAAWEKQFKGRWARWEGAVKEVTGDEETCRVSMTCPAGSDSITAEFELDRDDAVTLNRGQRIRVEGQLGDYEEGTYTLEYALVVARWQ